MKKHIIILIMLSLLLLSACGSTPSATPSDASENTPNSSSEAEVESTPEPEPEPTIYALGDTITLGDFEVTVDSWEVKKKITASTYSVYNADEGSSFIAVTMTIKNVGTSAKTLFSSYSFRDGADANIFYQGVYEYTGTVLLSAKLELHDDQMNPLETKSGFLAFSLPDEAANSDELTFVLTADNDSYTFTLN